MLALIIRFIEEFIAVLNFGNIINKWLLLPTPRRWADCFACRLFLG